MLDAASRFAAGAALIVFFTIIPVLAAAQDEVLVKAREAATSGRRQEALTMLEARLAAAPNDVDARLLYGLILSWDGRYDEARPVLRQVLAQTPNYTDARVALMNVEYWTGHAKDALALANEILAKHPGNPTARAVRERIDATSRPWWIKTEYMSDHFNDGRNPWREASLSLTRHTPVGSVIVRGSHANRFGSHDELVQAEFYPRFRPGTYAYLSVGASTTHDLYPQVRYAFDLYQSVGRGFEVSGGARFMDFGTVTQTYVATLTKYVGNWMVTGKLHRVHADDGLDSTTVGAVARRYYGADGTSYAGFGYSRGLSREEAYSLTDLALMHADTVRGEFDHLFGTRVRISGSVSTSRQERATQAPLWQTTLYTGLAVRF